MHQVLDFGVIKWLTSNPVISLSVEAKNMFKNKQKKQLMEYKGEWWDT